MRRAILGGAILIGAVVVVVALAAATSGSGLRFTDETPEDLRAVASREWQRFADAIPACADRLGGLTIGVAWELADRARYDPAQALVRIRAPGTASNLEATLLHEFAHHAERRCAPTPAFRQPIRNAGTAPISVGRSSSASRH